MSTTFVAVSRPLEGFPEPVEEWVIGTVSFSGGEFNPFPDGSSGSVPIDHFILHMETMVGEFEEAGDRFNTDRALSFWYLSKGAKLQGARAVTWA
jgi:hypothetical protein